MYAATAAALLDGRPGILSHGRRGLFVAVVLEEI